MEKYLDPALSPEERAEDLLGKMSLEEKVRQLGCTMVIPAIPMEYQDLKGGIGVSIVMGGKENYAEDLEAVQKHIMEQSPHHVPALFHGEALAGPVPLLGGSVYPISIGLGATFEPGIAREMSEFTRRQMLANGIRHGLSPVADLARDLRWGRTNETYGNDPTLSTEMTVEFVKGLQGEEPKEAVAATGKHFLGYSQTEGGLNCHKTMISCRELREQYAKPFEAAIRDAGLMSMMNCYSAIDGQPACASKEILTDLLREDLGFDGFVISDYGSVTQLLDPYCMTDDPTEAGIRCLEAGLDVEAPARIGYDDRLAQAVRDGRLSEEVVDTSVLRVLKLKFMLGLFEHPFPYKEDLEKAMDRTLADQGSYRAAQKSMTLMKNNGILPLEGKKKVLVAGPTGNCLRMMFSHYTAVAGQEMLASLASEGDTQQGFDIAGLLASSGEDTGSLDRLTEFAMAGQKDGMMDKYVIDDMIRGLYPQARTIYEALKEHLGQVEFVEGCDYKGTDESGIAKAVQAAKEADVVILAVGGKSGVGQSATTGEGIDSASLDLAGVQEKLMREVYAANPNIVIVHTDGRPLVSEWAYEHAAAILEGWLPNAYGGNAIADVLCGVYNPAGRTPVDVPRSAGHLPVYHCQANGSSGTKNLGMMGLGYIDAKASVLAPFGYGLSYTDFSYENFCVKLNEDTGAVTAEVEVQNIGKVTGEEVVQLYGNDLYASMIRPVHELIGFQRIALKPGEKKKVIFAFNIDFFSFLDKDMKWILEAGDFRLTVGSHSDDIRGEQIITWKRTEQPNYRQRCLYAQTTVE